LASAGVAEGAGSFDSDFVVDGAGGAAFDLLGCGSDLCLAVTGEFCDENVSEEGALVWSKEKRQGGRFQDKLETPAILNHTGS